MDSSFREIMDTYLKKFQEIETWKKNIYESYWKYFQNIKRNHLVNIVGIGKGIREVRNSTRISRFQKWNTNFNVTFSHCVCSFKSIVLFKKEHHLLEEKRPGVTIFPCFYEQVVCPIAQGEYHCTSYLLYDVIEAKVGMRTEKLWKGIFSRRSKCIKLVSIIEQWMYFRGWCCDGNSKCLHLFSFHLVSH